MPPPPRQLIGHSITVNLFGVDADGVDWQRAPSKGGPIGKGIGSFPTELSLQAEDGRTFSTMGSIADSALESRLGLSGANLIGQVKVTESNGKFTMLSLDAPVVVKYEPGTNVKFELTLYLHGKQLLAARVRTANMRYHVSHKRSNPACAPALVLTIVSLPGARRNLCSRLMSRRATTSLRPPWPS